MCRFKPRAAFAFLCASATIACADIDMCFRCVCALLNTHMILCLRDGAAARCMTHKNFFFHFCSCQHSYSTYSLWRNRTVLKLVSESAFY